MSAETLNSLTTDLFYRLCKFCGWITAHALHRVSNIQHHLWTALPVKSINGLQSKIAIVGTLGTEYANWDRLTVWSEYGRVNLLTLTTPRPRLNPACVVDGTHRLYILGGEDNETDDAEQRYASGVAVDSFDCENVMWETKPDMMTARSDFGAFCMLKELIAMGGNNAHDEVLETIDVCELGDGSWQSRNTLARARHNFALANIGCDIFAIGGLNDVGDIVPTIEVVSDGGKTIRTLTNIPEPVTGCMATALASKLIIIGGQIGPRLSYFARVQEFDTTTLTWAELQRLPMELSNGLLFHTETRIHVFGGHQKEGVARSTNDVEAIMNSREGQWIARRSPWNVVFGAAVFFNCA